MNLIDRYNEINQFGKYLNINFLSAKNGESKCSIEITKNHLATTNVAHGGVLSAFLDGVLGISCLSLSGLEKKLVSTIELKTCFLEPVYLNDILTGYGKVIKKGSRIYFSEGEVYNQNQKLIATATGTFNAYYAEKVGVIL